jgi:K+-transporting ATPase A subunit
MNPWVWRSIIIILAVAFIPLIISGTAALVTSGIHGISQLIQSLISPFSETGDAKLQGLIRLALYLIAITLLVRFLIGRR